VRLDLFPGKATMAPEDTNPCMEIITILIFNILFSWFPVVNKITEIKSADYTYTY